MEAGQLKGRPLPQWVLDEPLLGPLDSFYLRAWRELDTCRPAGFSLGDIPWTAIVAYGRHAGLDAEMVDALVLVIRKMDETYRKWHEAETDRRQKQRSPPDPQTIQR